MPRPASPLVVDTSAFSRLANDDSASEVLRRSTDGRFLFLSFVTVGEALRGARARGWSQARVQALEESFRPYGVLTGNFKVAQTYAELWALLKRAGTPVGDNDLWIAATALAQDPPLPVLTTDGDFRKIAAVSGLKVEGLDAT
jgi:tRNA(fMet)-specific endonuclease VapC